MKRKLFLTLASAVLVLFMIACSCSSLVPANINIPGLTTTQAANTPVIAADLPAGALTVVSTSYTSDDSGYFYVFGEIMNNSNVPVTGIELGITVTDASGASLLKDFDDAPLASDTFSPLLYTIPQGGTSPFSYYVGSLSAAPADVQVTIGNYTSSSIEPAVLDHQNMEFVDDGYGNLYLTGELVNTSAQWVHINGLAGGALDDADLVLSAASTSTYVAELAPAGDAGLRDRTPFAVYFPIPMQTYTQWSLWFDAEYATDVNDVSMVVEVLNSYFDDWGDAHIVGTLTNNSDMTLTTYLVGGLYDADGVVLDAGYSSLPVPAAPGESVPFDISWFSNVNYNETQAARVASFSVQFDTAYTYESSSATVVVTNSGETVQKDGSNWTVGGVFINSSEQDLTGAIVLVSVLDSANNLVAFASTYLYPEGTSFEPGGSAPYEISLYLPAGIDTTGFHTVTSVVGEISE